MEKICKNHGLTEFAIYGVRTRCKKCLVDAVMRRRRKVKVMAVEYKGGKCERCGYNRCVDALDFHHRDPLQKDFAIGAKGHCWSWEKVKRELDKCELVCSNCHREIHSSG